jgi:hypothetical protein
MTLKAIAAVAAGTALFWVGISAMPAAAQQEEPRCKTSEISAAGSATYLGKGRARRLAITAWQREVLAKHGERFTDFAKAKNGRFECEAAGIGTIGSLKRRCIVHATPCRLAALADDETIGESPEDRRVFRIQRLLSRLGYLAEAGVDGEYGPTTRQAVTRFQRDAGLRVTGEVDEITLERLQKMAASR